MVEGMSIKGWGFDWIKKERLPEFKIRMGIDTADELVELMNEVLKESDEASNNGKCKDVIKNIEDTSIIVRLYNGSVQTIISTPKNIPNNSYQDVEFRALIPVLGEEEVIHEGVIFINNGKEGCSCYLPFFPKHYGNIKPMSKIHLALEIIPSEIKIEKKSIFSKLRTVGCYNIKGESRPYKTEIVGKIIEKNDNNVYLIDAGFKFFCKINENITLKENQNICINGSIFGYIK